MGEIAGYERRITAALERIARSAEHLGPLVDAPEPAPPPPPPAPAEVQARIDALTRENQRLRAANAGLRESLALLEDQIAQGAVDPGSIDRALRAELEALRADRAAEVAELDGILAELKPLISGGLTHG
jgi:cell division protein FtsB